MRRRDKLWLVFLPLLVLALWALSGFHFLFYPLGLVAEPSLDVEAIRLEGSTLIVADLHLARVDSPSRLSGLAGFVAERGVRSLVIVGDLFASPGDAERLLGSSTGRDAQRVILGLLGLNGSRVDLYFLRGSRGHDPAGFNLTLVDKPSFRTLGKVGRFSVGGVRVLALHGDEVFTPAHGFVLSYLAGRPFIEALWKGWMGLDPEEWVVLAHSHMPGIDYTGRVANTGGWTDLLGLNPRGMGVFVADGQVSLERIRA